MKRDVWNKRGLMLFLSLILILPLAGCGETTGPELTPLQVTVLKVGKADAIVALSGTQAMVIDVGEEDDGPEVVDFLQKHHVSSVEALIVTHFDQDHVGGADTLLENMEVKAVYLPDYEGAHQEYFDFLTAAEAVSAPLFWLSEPVSFPFGDAQVLVEPPESYAIEGTEEDYDNNFSLITTVTHGENRLVFTGDAEKRRLREWLQGESAQPCDFLKVPHHGVWNGALDELMEALRPEIAVICDSKKNPAEEKTLELLHQTCRSVLETKDGNVTVISDGRGLEVQQKLKK